VILFPLAGNYICKMCFNIAYVEKSEKKFKDRFHGLFPDLGSQLPLFEHQPVYYFVSGFSHPVLPVITANGIDFYRWGLIPSWVKNAKQAKEIAARTLNAVGETVFEKPSFRNSIRSKRCILAVNGFYEWREFNGKKYPYLIQMKDKELFSLGCIYENRLDKTTGEILNTFSIITTPANPLMEMIHNNKKRMPLILPRENEIKWIDPDLKKEEIQSLIVPLDKKLMTSHTVSTNANSSRNNRNVSEIMNEVIYPELSGIS
jgi:putative SOS response-associated peptidase YedK